MRILWLATCIVWLSACSSYKVHCSKHLRPINLMQPSQAATAMGGQVPGAAETTAGSTGKP